MTKRITRPPLKNGRKTLYKEAYNDQAFKFCLLGAKDTELATFFEVSEKTLNTWKIQHPTFLQSLKAGRDQADANVGNRLYERAMGFEHDSEEIKVVNGEVVRVSTRKIYPPDTTAAIFWLKNRQKLNWRDQSNIDHTTKGEKIPAPQVYLPTDLPDSVVTTDQP